MEKYIKALLASDSRVIIPNLGAIQALRDDNEVSLSFNPYLNFNDGKLTQAIADGEGLSYDDASERLKAIVERVIDRMNEGEKVALDGIGTFFRTENGATTEFDAVSNYSDTTAEPQPNIVFDTPTPVDDDAPTTKDEQEYGKGFNVQDTPPFTPDTQQSEPESGPESNEPTYEPQEEKKSRKWLWILLILLLLLVGLALLLFVFKKDNPVYKLMFGEKEKTEQVDTKAKEKAEAEAKAKAEAEAKAKAEAEAKAAEEAKAKEEEAAKQKKSFDPGTAQKLQKRYNIIVGSYKNESSAAAKVADLHAKGFDEAFVGYRKEHYVAVIGAFSSIAEAEKMQEQIVDGKYHIESWITNSGE